MDITTLVVAGVGVLAAVIEVFLIPWVKTKWDRSRMEKLNELAKVAVAAADQLFTSEQREEKKAHAQTVLQAKGYNINLPEVDAAIEAAVLYLHNQLLE